GQVGPADERALRLDAQLRAAAVGGAQQPGLHATRAEAAVPVAVAAVGARGPARQIAAVGVGIERRIDAQAGGCRLALIVGAEGILVARQRIAEIGGHRVALALPLPLQLIMRRVGECLDGDRRLAGGGVAAGDRRPLIAVGAGGRAGVAVDGIAIVAMLA